MFKRDLIINLYTFDKTIFNLYKPQLANKFFPDGWKDMPKTYSSRAYAYNPMSTMEIDSPTVKTCSGIIDLFSSGFIIPSWSDMKLECMPEEVLCHSPSNMGLSESHSRSQVWDSLYEGYQHVKLLSPWLIKVSDDTKFAWMPCKWHRTDLSENFNVMTGVVEYKYQHVTNVQAFIKGGVSINAGDPLVHIVPITDRKIKLQYHLVEGKEFQSILGTKNLKYVGNYKERKEILSKPTCPFGFGSK